MSRQTYDIERYIDTIIGKRSEHIAPFEVYPTITNVFYPERTEYRFRYVLAGDDIIEVKMNLRDLNQLTFKDVRSHINTYNGQYAFNTETNKALRYLWECICGLSYPNREKLTKLALAESLK